MCLEAVTEENSGWTLSCWVVTYKLAATIVSVKETGATTKQPKLSQLLPKTEIMWNSFTSIKNKYA